MDPEILRNNSAQPARRSTRQSMKAVTLELAPRGPLKRRREESKLPSTPVNGSMEDDESPGKKNKSEIGVAGDGSCDEDEMDVQETTGDEDLDSEQNEEQEMSAEEDSSHHNVKQHKRPFDTTLMGHMNVNVPKTVGVGSQEIVDPRLYLLSRSSIHTTEELKTDLFKTKRMEMSRRAASGTKPATQLRPLENRPEVLIYKTSSMAEYKENMERKDKKTGLPSANHYSMRGYPTSEESYTSSCRVNNIPTRKQTTKLRKQDIKKSAVVKAIPGKAFGGYMWKLFQALVLLVSGVLGLLAYHHLSLPFRPSGGGDHPAWPVREGTFVSQLSALEALFPGQRSELWRRSRIHLERHLQAARPTEPVSLMLTAGRRGEKTLHCLALHLASAFSSALNASSIHIDGASKAGQDSDQVKLDIDTQLGEAFEGDQPVAVIHRFEELPPGSTIIFYRYCDHENAAYKEVFLLFTVLLPEEELGKELSLNEVEERVQDYITDTFVESNSSDKPGSYNRMDLDKLSGLWSRISHLVLPVAVEESIEQGGCMD
ncbi:torsin-1A-interacting protein 2 isoform X1 [Oncorhynchus tshawytscha]|uniref:Torsin-1A-interacting protein 1/2 AAA+ activator domain-containing protein n=1 Tax=Oncorhynchus tshawytscha TaxID=74940 RepID=A0AAZ3PVK0_ONCTS|nr:torsin-1A-interacting protein 2 isoform X1 [Oncorhynchus tshawytscha]